MWNLDSFEITYNLGILDNLIILNKAAIVKLAVCYPGVANEAVGTGAAHVGGTYTYARAGSYNDNENDPFICETDAEVKWSDILSGLQVSSLENYN